jgi:Rod binding protein
MNASMMLGSVSGAGLSGSVGLLADNAKARETERKFSSLVDGIRAGMDESSGKPGTDGTVSSSSVVADPRLPGDFISSLANTNPGANDRSAVPEGAAANSGMKGKVDRTSKLYEQALELESYFVKMMLSSMRKTVEKSELSGKNDFAGNMYEDMLYDELSRDVTKNAGFGLADQVYLQLSSRS